MIQDSVYLITGGASRLGKSTAEVLLLEGAYVTILDLKSTSIDSILKTYGSRALFFLVDVTSEKEVANAIDATKRRFGKLNGIINCAGINIKSPIFDFKKNEPHSLPEFTKIINVNLIGTFNVTRLAIPLLIENEPNSNGERGIIINTSSIIGHQGRPGLLAYSASKAGIVALTYPLAKELKNYGIRVVDIAPGYIDTPMTEINDQTTPRQQPENIFVSPKRNGKPSEFVNLVKTVIENAMLNGTSIKLDSALRI